MVSVFWILFAFVAYVYIGYPLGLHILSRLQPHPLTNSGPAGLPPGVSIIIAARNEGHRLAGRIDNLLGLDFPAARRQIIVVSDGSTDDSLEVLSRYRSAVDVIAAPPEGKACALNAGVERARFPLLVFADARQAFAPDALSALIAPFLDPHVGAVSGELVLDGEPRDRRGPAVDRRDPAVKMAEPIAAAADRRTVSHRRQAIRSTIADGVGLYWRYEKQIRRDESAIGSTVGATGAMYAMRRSLWTPLPAGTILDDVLAPMRCVLAGSRVVFEERARVFDQNAGDARAEGRRKLRTLAGNYQLFWLAPATLLPWRNPVWIQFISHKVARLAVPYALPMLWLLSLLLIRRSNVYAALFGAQCLFYLLAAYGAWLEDRAVEGTPVPSATRVVAPVPDRLARIALMFVVMNTSAVTGLATIVTRQKVWR
jgi:biofilm PGA synthesis N-glycosyltransferase PgaC